MNNNLISILIFVFIRGIDGKAEFSVEFQKGIENIDTNVDNQWMEYLDDIPLIQDFTACHWMNTKYFSHRIKS